jgi:hypothetical protein
MAKPDLDPRDALRNCVVHIRQTNDAIAEAEGQRGEAVAAGDLAAVRKINKRIAELKDDLGSLAEGRVLFEAQVGKLDAEARIAATDAAAEEMKPALDEVCAAIEQVEDLLLQAGKAALLVKEKFAAFEAVRRARYEALPRVPDWRASFNLGVYGAYLSEALEYGGKSGLEKIGWAVLEQRDRRWSATTREYAAKYVDDLKSAVREVEEERATANSERIAT